MHLTNDKSAIIRDVQRFLLVIGQNGDIPHLSVDGFYSEETAAAVRAFQINNGIEATGTVERETFDAIYAEYGKIMGMYPINNRYLSYPIKLGDSGFDVEKLNLLIRELAAYYKDLPIAYGNFYSKATENAVRMLQRYLRFNENGEASVMLLEALTTELKERQKFKTT